MRSKLPNLMNRRLQDICILMYKVKYKLCPSNICNIFEEHSLKYNLKQSDFSTPRYNSVTYGRHLLRHLGPKLWTKLSSGDRSAKTLNEFKRRIRGKNLPELIETGCKGCILCSTWYFYLFFTLTLIS